MMVGRIWHGWTKPENADKYEQLLKTEIFPAIGARKVDGYKGIQLFRRPLGDEIEFITIMWFESFDAVRAFAGEDYEVAVVPPKARALLSRFDARSQHYEVKERLEYQDKV
jgi:antibiotic biosynthesis monooxygenase (ABM) superfamily enzyme